MSLQRNPQITSLVVAGSLIAGSHPVLLNLCKIDGKVPFNSATLALLIEYVKVLISLLFILKEREKVEWPGFKTQFLYSVPALLYCFNNNLITHTQNYMDPASFQVVSNLKIGTTAFFYFLLIDRNVSRRKWISVALLFLAAISNSFGGLQNDVSSKKFYVTKTGVIFVIVYCMVSGLAGVYTEMVLKKYKTISIHCQNITLYIYGMLSNFVVYLISSDNSSLGFFDGHSHWSVLIIATQAINGVIISMIMKYSNNLTRLLMFGLSVVFTTIMSSLLFGYQLHIYFMISLFLTISALYLYA